MKILHLISSAGLYGAENVLLNICERLKNDGHKPYLICLKNNYKPDPDVYIIAKNMGIDSMVLSCNGKIDFSAIQKIVDFVNKHKIELMHAHGYKSNILGLFAARCSRVPIVATVHLWTHQTFIVRVYEALDKLLIRFMDHVVAVSPIILKQLKALGIRANKTSVILNGVDTVKFSRNNSDLSLRGLTGTTDGIVIGSVGRLTNQKGHIFLIEAFNSLQKKISNLKLLIVGNGELKNRLINKVNSLNLSDKVVFADYQKDMQATYNSMDIFVLPSISEGLPLVLLEAMSMELPVVATRVGGISNIIEGDEGIIVEPKDVMGLERAIMLYINDEALRKKTGVSARKKVSSRFSLEICYEQYIKIYSKFLSMRLRQLRDE